MTNLLHSTWFWLVIIASPAVTMIGIMARLLRPPPSASDPEMHGKPAGDAQDDRHLPNAPSEEEPK
jgi:hypothetical protein